MAQPHAIPPAAQPIFPRAGCLFRIQARPRDQNLAHRADDFRCKPWLASAQARKSVSAASPRSCAMVCAISATVCARSRSSTSLAAHSAVFAGAFSGEGRSVSISAFDGISKLFPRHRVGAPRFRDAGKRLAQQTAWRLPTPARSLAFHGRFLEQFAAAVRQRQSGARPGFRCPLRKYILDPEAGGRACRTNCKNGRGCNSSRPIVASVASIRSTASTVPTHPKSRAASVERR